MLTYTGDDYYDYTRSKDHKLQCNNDQKLREQKD